MKTDFGNFHRKAKLYAKYRPQYSKKYFKYLQGKLQINKCSTVADIGAGTGIHTKALAQIAGKLFAVEPDIEMLTECHDQLGSCSTVEIVHQTAENTGLPDACVDYITVAQAFHLFDAQKCIKEFRRILRPHGTLILVWNSKENNNDLFFENEMVIKKYCSYYSRDIHARTFSKESYKKYFTKTSYNYVSFHCDSTEFLDKQTFIMRTMSASYAITDENLNYNAMIEDLGYVFDRYAKNGFVEVPQSTVIYHGTITEEGF